MKIQNIECVLFDLDGTLLDTAPDMVDAINQILIDKNLKPKPYNDLRNIVSHGGAALIKAGLEIDESDSEYEQLLKKFLDIYKANIANKTSLFPGMEKVLNKLEKEQIPWGIVTNKPHWLTSDLVNKLELDTRTNCIISGDTLSQKKPHPAPLLHACKILNVAPENTIYVGDAQRDIEAGNNASMHTLIALFGYIDEKEKTELWQADGLIEKPEEILKWF